MSYLKKQGIIPTRKKNYSNWYQCVIKEAGLADNSDVRGCIIFKPWGYAIWENIQKILDNILKINNYENVYFPLLIPKKFFEKELMHVKGFAKECAIVTHTKLTLDQNNTLIIDGKLEDPLIVRPTSETIIGATLSKWINSYRDLPIKINQWVNVMRWEMRPRCFLRTSEFLWQEGHTVFPTEKDAIQETYLMLKVYKNFVKNYMAIPVFNGIKSPLEKFPGAEITLCLEAMMQDRKALQLCTSHFLGQNFAKSFNILYTNNNGKNVHGWTTSFGITTRILGAMIMVHGDDYGIVIPPNISPYHIIILPIIKNDQFDNKVLTFCKILKSNIEKILYLNNNIRVHIDNKFQFTSIHKKWKWIKKGIPLIVEIGKKEIELNNISFFSRINPLKLKFINYKNFLLDLPNILSNLQNDLYKKALNFKNKNTIYIKSKKDFYNFFESNNGFALIDWNKDNPQNIELELKQKLKVSNRCIFLNNKQSLKKCLFSNTDTKYLAIFAKSY